MTFLPQIESSESVFATNPYICQFFFIITLCAARNRSTNGLFPRFGCRSWRRSRHCRRHLCSRPTRSKHINTTSKFYSDRPVLSMTSQRRTEQQEETRLVCYVWKQRHLTREDIASVAMRRCFASRWARRSSSCHCAAHRNHRYIRRFPILSSVISAGYFILSWV